MPFSGTVVILKKKIYLRSSPTLFVRNMYRMNYFISNTPFWLNVDNKSTGNFNDNAFETA